MNIRAPQPETSEIERRNRWPSAVAFLVVGGFLQFVATALVTESPRSYMLERLMGSTALLALCAYLRTRGSVIIVIAPMALLAHSAGVLATAIAFHSAKAGRQGIGAEAFVGMFTLAQSIGALDALRSILRNALGPNAGALAFYGPLGGAGFVVLDYLHRRGVF